MKHRDRRKHKNADFYKELDKDRRGGTREYAVLATMLKQITTTLTQGLSIATSGARRCMWCPKFFIQIIDSLRPQSLQAVNWRFVREQNIDITHFEAHLDAR